MHELFSIVAEAKIREAIRNGELKNLSGQGKPLVLDNMSLIPADQRMAYKIMKNAGLVPEEVELQKEINSLKQLVDSCDNEEKKETLKKRLKELSVTLSIIMEKRRGRR